MSLFGLFGGADSDSEDENKTVEATEENEPIAEDNSEENLENVEEEKPVKVKSKWRGVLEEYDSSSYLHHFVKDDDETDGRTDDQPAEEKTDGSAPDIQTDASNLANLSKSFLSRDACERALQSTIKDHRKMTAELQRQQELEERQRNLEIAAIQGEIEADRAHWQPVYSDEEGEGVEVEKKKRKKKEYKGNINFRSGEGTHFPPGERWKRLKLMAETKVKNNPEKYASIPIHKFPLRP
jgi:hypothetical protein